MSNFKEASRLKLRINTTYGLLSVEQLWDLSLNKLAVIIKGVKKTLSKENDDEPSFLDGTKTIDVVQQLTFDILKGVYQTKKSEMEADKTLADVKAHNEEILSLIYQKEKQSMGEKSVEELRALLK